MNGKLANELSLDANDLEFIQIKKEFETTVSGKFIRSISRIQNPKLYNHYAFRKKFIDQSNPPNTTNERWLYHGCKETDTQKIRSHGFGWKNDITVAYQHVNTPVMNPFGDGTCFTVKASSSVHPLYSPAGQNGYKHMFLARVLTGEYTLGTAGQKVPPLKDTSNGKEILYDSVVDNMISPEVFVVFNHYQCYPEYLIIYK